MLNMEKAQEENSGMDIGYVDAAYSYYLHDGKIISYLSLNESGQYWRLILKQTSLS